MTRPAHRGTVFVEDARILAVDRYPDQQYVLRMLAPSCASHAAPGAFVHLRCNEDIPMRRPLSILRANPSEGWIEVLFKVMGPGLRSLGAAAAGDTISCLGPVGNGFRLHAERPGALLIGGGVGIPPMVFLAERMVNDANAQPPVVLMGSEIAFPFEQCESGHPVAGVDSAINRSMASLEAIGVPARLASLSEFAGTYRGYVTDLARCHLDALPRQSLDATELFACGPTPMLAAVAGLAAEYGLPCQVSLEEYMACAVGGCAGCTVRVVTPDGPAMKRVCVDGPVFDAAAVFAAA